MRRVELVNKSVYTCQGLLWLNEGWLCLFHTLQRWLWFIYMGARTRITVMKSYRISFSSNPSLQFFLCFFSSSFLALLCFSINTIMRYLVKHNSFLWFLEFLQRFAILFWAKITYLTFISDHVKLSCNFKLYTKQSLAHS